MKKLLRLVLGLLLGLCVTSCGESSSGPTNSIDPNNKVDYVPQLKLDMNSNTKKQKVTIKTCIDGDTTHFYASESFTTDGVVKARYLAIDTPESTGKIQAWGKAASTYNKSKLTAAESIYIESDDDKWNLDSTADRHLLWVWYRSTANEEYRLLNLELLQEGYAGAKNISSTRYAETLTKAYNQAVSLKLRYYGTEKDPGFDYGSFNQVTLREIRTNISEYDAVNVRFEGLITVIDGTTIYVEDYDEETDMSYGMQIFTGYGFGGWEILKIGNIVSFAATISYSDGYGYQASNLYYFVMRPDNEKNTKLVSENNVVTPTTISADDLNNDGSLLCDTFVKMESLTVTKIYTTTNETSSSIGAMTLTCKTADNKEVQVRTSVLYEEDGETLVTEDKYKGKTIDVVGIVDEYDDEHQVHAYVTSDITIHSN